MSERVPITIIGAGVIGCAIAHQLSKTTRENRETYSGLQPTRS